MGENNGYDKRKPLSDDEIETIKAQLLDSIYADIGKSIVKKFLWICGAVVSGALGALTLTGHIKW